MVTHQLTDTQAFWLGHLFRAYSPGQSLSVYAEQQRLDFAELMWWRQRLAIHLNAATSSSPEFPNTPSITASSTSWPLWPERYFWSPLQMEDYRITSG